jgi:hypothetical protein
MTMAITMEDYKRNGKPKQHYWPIDQTHIHRKFHPIAKDHTFFQIHMEHSLGEAVCKVIKWVPKIFKTLNSYKVSYENNGMNLVTTEGK